MLPIMKWIQKRGLNAVRASKGARRAWGGVERAECQRRLQTRVANWLFEALRLWSRADSGWEPRARQISRLQQMQSPLSNCQQMSLTNLLAHVSVGVRVCTEYRCKSRSSLTAGPHLPHRSRCRSPKQRTKRRTHGAPRSSSHRALSQGALATWRATVRKLALAAGRCNDWSGAATRSDRCPRSSATSYRQIINITKCTAVSHRKKSFMHEK